MKILRTVFMSLLSTLPLADAAETIETLTGTVQLMSPASVTHEADCITIQGQPSKPIVMAFDLQNGHPIRIAPRGRQADVMMVGSGNSGIGITGFFSRKNNAAIVFEADRLKVEALSNNVANSGSGSYRIEASSNNGSVRIRQIDRMLSGREAPRLGENYVQLEQDFVYRPMSRFDREKGPGMGVCTWAFYLQNINEKDVLGIGRWMRDHFLPYGATILQIDDGWQKHGVGGIKAKGDFRVTHPQKFPKGMAYVGKELNRMGIDLGIWMLANYNCAPDLLKEHADWYMKAPDGSIADGKWPGHLFDVTNPQLWEEYYIPLFREAADEWGVKYFKFDGLKWPGRHLYHDVYHPVLDEKDVDWSFYETRYKKEDLQDINQAYNDWMVKLRALIGPDTYVLGCQGPAYWASGAVSASRFTGDIFGEDEQLRTLADAFPKTMPLHANAFWLDPDHLLFGQVGPKKKYSHSIEKCRLWASMVALSGTVVMPGDKVVDLPKERIDLYHQILPIVPVHPVDFRKMGRKSVWALNLKRDFDEWTVASLFNFDEETKEVSTSIRALALTPYEKYIVWNYFREKLVPLKGGSISYTIAPMANELLSIHRKLGHPQVISTTRHLTQGGVELENVVWDAQAGTLTIDARTILDEDYDIIVYAPANFKAKSLKASRTAATYSLQDNGIIRIKIRKPEQGTARLTLSF